MQMVQRRRILSSKEDMANRADGHVFQEELRVHLPGLEDRRKRYEYEKDKIRGHHHKIHTGQILC